MKLLYLFILLLPLTSHAKKFDANYCSFYSLRSNIEFQDIDQYYPLDLRIYFKNNQFSEIRIYPPFKTHPNNLSIRESGLNYIFKKKGNDYYYLNNKQAYKQIFSDKYSNKVEISIKQRDLRLSDFVTIPSLNNMSKHCSDNKPAKPHNKNISIGLNGIIKSLDYKNQLIETNSQDFNIAGDIINPDLFYGTGISLNYDINRNFSITIDGNFYSERNKNTSDTGLDWTSPTGNLGVNSNIEIYEYILSLKTRIFTTEGLKAKHNLFIETGIGANHFHIEQQLTRDNSFIIEANSKKEDKFYNLSLGYEFEKKKYSLFLKANYHEFESNSFIENGINLTSNISYNF